MNLSRYFSLHLLLLCFIFNQFRIENWIQVSIECESTKIEVYQCDEFINGKTISIWPAWINFWLLYADFNSFLPSGIIWWNGKPMNENGFRKIHGNKTIGAFKIDVINLWVAQTNSKLSSIISFQYCHETSLFIHSFIHSFSLRDNGWWILFFPFSINSHHTSYISMANNRKNTI